MAGKQDFMAAYPLNARAAIHSPMAFIQGFFASENLPPPTMEGIRDFTRFAGIGDGAMRTALSRAKKEGSLVAFSDAAGRTRYRLSDETFAMGTAQVRADRRPEGFLIAIFSFKTEEAEARSVLRGILKSYGFRKLAQNAYIHGRIESSGLMAAVRGAGLEDNFFLFTCVDIDDDRLVGRVFELFDLKGRAAYLREYLTRLKDFLPDGISGDDAARRLLYVGAVHWERVEAGEPPFPARYLPKDYSLAEIQSFYGKRLMEGAQALLGYCREKNA